VLDLSETIVGGPPVADLAVGEVVVLVLVTIAAALLVPAGVAKLRHPAVAREALGAPARIGDGSVRLLGVGELLLAAAVLIVGGTVPVALLAGTYLGFTAVAARQRSRGESCGCFGVEADAPTGLGHVAVDALAATAAAVGAVLALPSLLSAVLADPSPLVAPLLLGVVVATASAQMLLTALPDLLAAQRETGGAT
jgi:hypothetical protein